MPAFVVAAVIFGLVVLCDDSYEQAKMEADHYSDMVCRGYWPDYDKRGPDCADYIKGE